MEEIIRERLIETNLLINRYILKNEINPLNYQWNMIADDISNNHNLKIVGYPFGEVSKNFHSGMLAVNNQRCKIFYNINMDWRRQHFTICHELNHFIFDTEWGKTKNFLSSQIMSVYTEEEKQNEKIIDCGAGVFMMPDITIVKFLETNFSFETISEKMEMTPAALYVRLVQFLETTAGLNNDYARRLINDFRYDGRRESINRILDGWGSTIKKQIVLDYENCL